MTPAEAIAPLPALRGLAVRLAGQDAEDLMQDVAERAIRCCVRLATETDARRWLCVAMRNRAADGHRLAWNRRTQLEDAPEPAAPDDTEMPARWREVMVVIGRMFPGDQRALMAAMLGEAVDPRALALARKRLRAALGDGA